MAYNLFDTILKMVNPETKQAFSQAGQEISKTFSPLTPVSQWVSQAITKTGQELAKPFIQAWSNIVTPVKKQFDYTKKVSDYYKPFRESINQLGLTAEDIAQIPEDKKEQILSWLREIGVTLPEMPKPLNKWEDLGIMGNIKEGAIGAFRAGEQIPTIVGSWLDYLTQNVTSPLVSGWLEMIWAEWAAQKFREASKKTGEFYKKTGEDITMAGMTDGGTNPLTQKQIDARKFGGQMALTAPIGGGYVAWAKWVWWLALRSGVVGAWFGATQPIIDKGAEATMWDIATGWAIGGVTGAVAWPLISKVIAPAIGGIASKAGKYWQALVKWGAEWLKKSVARDISALKAPGVETVTRNIPKAVVRRDLGFTPTERAKIEKITWLDEWTYILSKWLAGKGKEELAEVFMKQSDDMYNGITKNLASVDTKVQSPIAKEALMDIMEQLESSPKIARAYAKDIEWVKAMLARDEFTLSELNSIRRAYDKVNTGMFTVQWKARSGLENAIDVKVRQDLSNQLQNEAKKYWVDVKAMNTELRAWLEMKDALLRSLSQDEKNNFIGLQDLGVSAILSGGNPVTAIATIWAKKYGEKIAPWLAQKAFNLNKAPNVTRNVSRGNTISTGNKSSRLGLASKPSGNVVYNGVKKPIVKPNTIKNESKVNKPISSNTIPEGYFKNAFWEIQKNPSNKKGGFIKIPEIGKKSPVKNPLVEEARRKKLLKK